MERLTFRAGKKVYIRKPYVACSANRPVSERLFCVNCSGPQDRKKCLPLMVIDRLAAYEDTGLSPEEIKALIEPSNDPLTLDELREMDGMPVWCVDGIGNQRWGLVNHDSNGLPICYDNEAGYWDGCIYGMTGDGKFGLHQMGWRAYRSKPEGGSGYGEE